MENILVIYDDETLNTVITRALRRRGLDAEGACSAQAALTKAQQKPPGRVVLDLNLAANSVPIA